MQELACIDYGGAVYRSSSELEGAGFGGVGTYGMHTLFGGDRHTGWSEGAAGPGIGEVLWLAVERDADTLLVVNGFARTAALFGRNNRVKSLRVSLWAGLLGEDAVTEIGPVYQAAPLGPEVVLTLDDHDRVQRFALPRSDGLAPGRREALAAAYRKLAESTGLPPLSRTDSLLRLEILDIYAGTAWHDTCLTELRVFRDATFAATRVYGEDGAVVYDTAGASGRVLYRQRDLLFEPYALDSLGRWCLAIQSPAQARGRVETGLVLFRLPHPQVHVSEAFAEAVRRGRIPESFAVVGGRTAVVFDDGSRVAVE